MKQKIYQIILVEPTKPEFSCQHQEIYKIKNDFLKISTRGRYE